AGIISPSGGLPDTVSIVDLHDLSKVSKIPIVGAYTVSIHSSPNEALILSEEAIFFAGAGNGGSRLIRLDRGTGKTTAFEIPGRKPNWNGVNIYKAGNHIVFPTGPSLEVFSIQNKAFIASVP